MFSRFSFSGRKPLICLSLATLMVACATTSVQEGQPVKSQNDDYQYRLLTLDNAMEVLLISDPESPKAAASLAVRVGSGDNPADREGLAHFLEHMLFLGTDKYPNAAEYEQFVTEHGGNRNAYTSFEQTNYFFDINAAHLPEALDRFAQFFIAPRFDAEYVDREKNAVEAEYQVSLKSDPRRGLNVLQEVMNQNHSFSQFSVGSLETLADRPDASVREDLLRFYAKHYSANAMRLVVFGAHTLDELEAMAIPMFNQVPNKSFEYEPMDAPIFEPGSLPMVVQVKPLATARKMELFFPIADYRKNYREHPLIYLGNLIGHEGSGSLLSQFKAEGLAESLAAGVGLGWRGGALFSVDISLTEKGIGDPDRVLQLLFAYMDMVRAEGPRDWLYEEQSNLAKLSFRYKEQGSPMRYVSDLASGMLDYAPQDTLRGPYMMDRYDPQMLTEVTAGIRPDNALVVLSHASAATDTVSELYSVHYSKAPLDVSEISIAADDPGAKALHLPFPNEFIAEDVSLVRLPREVPEIPEVVLETARQRIWFMPDDEFRLPKGGTYINFRSPDIGQNALNSAQAALYAAMLTDQVNEFSYPARLAGLSFSFYRHSQGISLKLRGYNDKQALLLQRLLDNVKAADFDPQRFDNIRNDMIRSLKNSVAKRPSSQLMDDLGEALVYGSWGEQAAIAALEETDLNGLKQYVAEFWDNASAEVLLHGNYERGAVDAVSDMLAALLSDEPAPVMPPLRLTKLESGEAALYAVDIPHDDSVTAWYLQGRGLSWTDRAATSLTAQIMTSGFFQQLRTEQQLGYIVSAFSWAKLDVPGLVLLVQSPVADAGAVTQAMEVFMQGVLPSLNEAQFERHRVALVSDILRPDKNLAQRSEFYWQSIARKHWDFEQRQHLADAVGALTLDDWTAYYQQVFLQQRHSLGVISPGRWKTYPEAEAKTKTFNSADDIKASHESYELQ